jgi:hypothetical protein
MGRTFDVLPGEQVQDPVDDVEQAFLDWVEGLKDSDSPGHIRAFRVPIDEQGRASHSSTGQVRLGTWPIDQYDFDTLCTKIMREYMLPSETMMAVRLIGTLAGKSGVRFNKLVTLQRPNTPALSGPKQPDGIADVMKAVQESNERMMRLFTEMGGSRSEGGQSEMMRTVAMMRVMMEPMQAMLGPMLAAVAGRPLPAAAPGSSMKETMETMMLMDRFLSGKRGGGHNTSSNLSDVASIATAISGVAKPVLEMAAANAANLRTRKSLVPATQPAASSTPAQIAPAAIPTTVVAPTHGIDLTRPTTTSISPFAPGPNLEAPSSHVGDNHMFAMIKNEVDALVMMADNGSEPISVANQFFDTTLMSLDDLNYSKLATIIESDDFVTSVSVYNSRVMHHAGWFTKLREQLVKRIIDENSAV